jgi:ubiquitin-activating enzyme E1
MKILLILWDMLHDYELKLSFLCKDKNQIKSTEVSIDDVIIALMKNAILVDEVDEGQSVAQYICTKLEKPKQIAPNFKDELNIATFEKDDDSNGHVAFVTAASNLHAISYGIMPVDAIETRRVAGCIVPAMITTTALVSALSCIELIKLLQNAPLHSYQNAFVNLALPFFAFTAPLPAEVVPGLHDSIHTIWDRIIIKESKKSKEKGGITLWRLTRQIKKTTSSEGIEISNISFGPYMLNANFLHKDDTSVLDKPVCESVTEAILSNDDDLEFDDDSNDRVRVGVNIDKEKLSEVQQTEIQALECWTFLDLSVIAEDPEMGEEAELPPVRLKFFDEETKTTNS